MCGRYTLNANAARLARQFGIDGGMQWQQGVRPRYNIAPGQGILAVYEDANRDCRSIDFFHWGLVPSWVKDPNSAQLPINARSETVAEKPSFKDALRYRRCLIPADGWYEWKEGDGHSQPWYIRPANSDLVVFAGIWEHWQDPGGSEIVSACILTVPPPKSLRKIHSRMPAVLSADVWQDWLEPRNQDPAIFDKTFRPLSDADFTAHPVGDGVNKVGNDSAELIQPVAERGSNQVLFDW